MWKYKHKVIHRVVLDNIDDVSSALSEELDDWVNNSGYEILSIIRSPAYSDAVTIFLRKKYLGWL